MRSLLFFWRNKCCPRGSLHHSLFIPHEGLYLTPHLLPPPHRHPQPFLPSWPCLRASPLEGQVNRGPGSAQVRLVPIRHSLPNKTFHLPSLLPACQRQSSPQDHWVQCVCVCVLWFQLYGSLEVQNTTTFHKWNIIKYPKFKETYRRKHNEHSVLNPA